MIYVFGLEHFILVDRFLYVSAFRIFMTFSSYSRRDPYIHAWILANFREEKRR